MRGGLISVRAYNRKKFSLADRFQPEGLIYKQGPYRGSLRCLFLLPFNFSSSNLAKPMRSKNELQITGNPRGLKQHKCVLRETEGM